MGKRIRRVEVWKHVGSYDSFIRKKPKQTKKRKNKWQKNPNNCSPPGNWCLSGLWEMVAPAKLSPRFYCWVWCHVIWNVPLVSWGHLSHLYSLTVSCAPLAYSLVGQCEKQKRPLFCVSTAQQYIKHPCIINIVFITNPKFRTIKATMKKINYPSQNQYNLVLRKRSTWQSTPGMASMGWIKGRVHIPWPADNNSLHAAQKTISLLCCKGTWLLMSNLMSTRTPRVFSAELQSSCSVLSLYWCLGLFLPRCWVWHFLLNCMRFLSVCFSSLSRSLWMAAQQCVIHFSHFWVICKLRVYFSQSSRSLVKMLNKIRPGIDPWGTALVIGL